MNGETTTRSGIFSTKAQVFIGLSLLAVLSLIGLWIAKIFTKNPPIKIVGGSIIVQFDNNFSIDGQNQKYHGQVTTTTIYAKHLHKQGASGAAVNSIQVPNGFIINFYDSEPDGLQISGVQICSQEDCSFAPGSSTYIRINPARPDAQFVPVGMKEIDFRSIKCPPTSSSTCARPEVIGIILDGKNETMYDCGGHGETQKGQCVFGMNEEPN